MKRYNKYFAVRSLNDIKDLHAECAESVELLTDTEKDLLSIQAHSMMEIYNDILDLEDKYLEDATKSEENGDIALESLAYFKIKVLNLLRVALHQSKSSEGINIVWQTDLVPNELYGMLKENEE